MVSIGRNYCYGEGAANNYDFSFAMLADGSRVVVGAGNKNDAKAANVRIFDWKEQDWVQVGACIDGEDSTTDYG